MAFKDKFSKFFGLGNSRNQEENNVADEKNEVQENTLHSEDGIQSDYTAEEVAQDVKEDVTEIEAASSDEEVTETEAVQEEVAETVETTEPAEEIHDEVNEESSETEFCEKAETTPEEDASVENVQEKKTGFFARLKSGLGKTRASINDKLDSVLKMFQKVGEELFEELEEALIMADVGVDTSLFIISELRDRVKSKKITESQDVKGEIEEIISEILTRDDNSLNLESSPAVIMVIGVNGVGKTTSIGKLAARLKSQGKKVVLGAADTFRAAAIDQLDIWANRSGIDIVKHQEGSDPAAVVFDTIAAAKARGSDVIILDTAGRLHNKKNLMDELNKISRVIERELPTSSKEVLLVLDATTGQNAVTQAKLFCETASITGIILTKLDGSAKGGIVLAISHEQNIPVKLIGVGEGIDDLQDFDSSSFAKALFTE